MSEVRIVPTIAETAESGWWQPTGETYVQAVGPGHVSVIVESRIDISAPAALIERASIKAKPILRYAQMPWMRVRFVGNVHSDQVTVKSHEQ